MHVVLFLFCKTIHLQTYFYKHSLTPASIWRWTAPDLTRGGHGIDQVLDRHRRIAGLDMMGGNGLDLGACFGFARDGSSAGNFGVGAALEQKDRPGMRVTALGVNFLRLEESLFAGEGKSSDEGPLVEIEGGIVGNGLVLGEDGAGSCDARYVGLRGEQERCSGRHDS